MKILWITNIILPPICEKLNLPIPAVGGWMYSALNKLTENNTIDRFAIASVWDRDNLEILEFKNVTYFLLPLNGKKKTEYNKHLEKHWKYIKEIFHPDITHIHGSEYPHGLAYVRACGSNGVIVSIQGMISVIARYYTASISNKDIRQSLTFRDFFKGSILYGQKALMSRGKYEIELLSSVHHIVGRTEWDKSHVWAINPNAKYHHVGETLRETFYQHSWSYSKCVPHTIFVSQGSYPIKGLHKLLEAMHSVLREFPDAKVYVAGTDESSKPWYRITGYGKYLKKIIRKNNLIGKVFFMGMLNEEEMCKHYLMSNLFVCCSSIENSPNSLGEAQMLGVPHLATYAGGIPEIVNYNSDVLYRFEETEMLAEKICKIFELRDRVIIPKFDIRMYDEKINTKQLMGTYNLIQSENA